MKKKAILCLMASLLLRAVLSGQERLAGILGEQTLTLREQIDSVVQEFGLNVQEHDLERAFRILKYTQRNVRTVAVTYRSEDPSGRPVLASGLIAYPERGKFRGVVEMLPYNREKSLCGTRRLYTPEVLASVLGYVTLIPDNIGYGTTDSLTVAYQMSENSALLSAHLREAAAEYFRSGHGRTLPRRSIIFGYSLGAANALALAYHYTDHPGAGVKVRALCLGSGAYDPAEALDGTLQGGSMNYLIYPAFVRSLNAWAGAGLHPEKLFCGRVLDDFDAVSSSIRSPLEMASEYGTDLHAYLHHDFFADGNEDIVALKAVLASLAMPKEARRPLPASVEVVLRHSATDDIVPVSCSDRLYTQLKGPGRNVQYRRDKKGTHYETAVRSFMDLAFLLL